MQFHHHGYVSGDPRVAPAAPGATWTEGLPDEVDVLIVGAGPAGVLLAAQLAQFPSLTTRLVERREGRLEIGQADGIQARSVETFQAFGFAGRITEEAYRITEMCFWAPDPSDPARIVRTAREKDDPHGISEFPHLIVNQARVLDHFTEVMRNSPTRMGTDYGWEFVDLRVHEGREHPVEVHLRTTAGVDRTVHAKYVVGCDGARSGVRRSIGRSLTGDAALHAWAVMDVLAVTDFPDIRTKCAIQSAHGSILHIPREGGHLFRMYVDLGDTAADDAGAVRTTTVETAIERANAILHPYTLDVKDVAWYSVYEVGHRLTDRFDDVPHDLPAEQERDPRVFIAGDACHTHSAKAGQGMNVSMQDAFNLGWKLAHVLTGRSPASLLRTYSAERQVIAQNLIDFDKEWSTLMAKKPEDFDDPGRLGEFYTTTAEFPAGFRTHYPASQVVAGDGHQDLAKAFTVGKRFKSPRVSRVADGNPVHLGHHARADGRWRLYAFADAAGGAAPGPALEAWARWLATDPASPVVAHTRDGEDLDALFDVKVVFPVPHTGVDLGTVPAVFLPRTGPFGLVDHEKVYALHPDEDVFTDRGIDPAGCVVAVRPDQYVAAVVPLTDREELPRFFAGVFSSPA
ncbi:FAD-dependent monooxygenase [Kineococcus sp. SYSU DK001]|uniref:FAD-dependent monooxygenase n=1 Tax=Kineococcus sp. SYSU DK001 TaxID=3383122 RepID=UPI003D7C8101